MYEITIKGTAKTYYDFPADLHGIDCELEFSQFFGREEQALQDKNVREGYMSFQYEDRELWTVTTYTSDEALTKEEIDLLVEFTTGQWSDGIGEGFEQE